MNAKALNASNRLIRSWFTTRLQPTSAQVSVEPGDDVALDLCTKQLRKLINVVDVTDFKEGQAVARELVLVKVKADAKSRPELLQIKDIFRAKIVNLTPDSIIIEATGDDEKVTALLGLLEPFGIIELARTGRLALKR